MKIRPPTADGRPPTIFIYDSDRLAGHGASYENTTADRRRPTADDFHP